MRVLVTGGSGFIGANFVRYWMREHGDDTVINIDALTYAANQENLADVADNANYIFEHGDITDTSRVDDVFARHQPDVVVHFAAESHVDRSLADRSIFVKTNVVGTQVLLDAALAHGVDRFHHISTDEVFGAIGDHEQRAFSETTAYDPRNPYSASKAASDHLVRAYHNSFGLAITITNCSNNYGPFQMPEKMISLAITNLVEGKPIPVYGEGLQSRDWLHVEDHCSAVDMVLQHGTVGSTYCIGGVHEQVSNIAVARRICALLGKDTESSIKFVTDRPGHDFKYVVDWSKASDELGWNPSRSFDEGLAETVDWYVANRQWWEPIKNRQPAVQRVNA